VSMAAFVIRDLVHAGYEIVPRDPTQGMLEEARREAEFTDAVFDDEEMAGLYRAMIKAWNDFQVAP
jgi:hypothetical protein